MSICSCEQRTEREERKRGEKEERKRQARDGRSGCACVLRTLVPEIGNFYVGSF